MTGQNVKTGNTIVNLFPGERCMPATKVPIDQSASSCGSLLDFGPASVFAEATTQRLQVHDIVHCVFAFLHFGTRVVTFSLLGVRVCHYVRPR